MDGGDVAKVVFAVALAVVALLLGQCWAARRRARCDQQRRQRLGHVRWTECLATQADVERFVRANGGEDVDVTPFGGGWRIFARVASHDGILQLVAELEERRPRGIEFVYTFAIRP